MSRVNDRDSKPDLPDLAAAEQQRLQEMLQHAWSPGELDAARHERLLQAALEDPFAAASPEELLESERLRQALDGQGDHEHLPLARALSAAFEPRLERPLPAPELEPKANVKRSGQLIVYRFAALGSALAVAAAVLLWLSPQLQESSAPAPDLASLALAQSRSTAALFPAGSVGAPSERIDRIARARGRELRDNRYALWGVR